MMLTFSKMVKDTQSSSGRRSVGYLSDERDGWSPPEGVAGRNANRSNSFFAPVKASGEISVSHEGTNPRSSGFIDKCIHLHSLDHSVWIKEIRNIDFADLVYVID
jgi:hypothetical protein